MSDKTGGPAFPWVQDSGEAGPEHISGMTLRDYFAARALTGIWNCKYYEVDGNSCEDIAELAYIQADAMLKQKEKHDE